MADETFYERWDAITRKVDVFERLADRLAATLNPPLFYHSGADHFGFRYGQPDARHFALLKLVRVVSCLRAAVTLARGGFSQEAFVLLRTLFEFSSQIDFVLLSKTDEGAASPAVLDLLREYFADFARHQGAEPGKIKLRQGDVHKAVGSMIDSYQTDKADESAATHKLMWRVYQTLSHYVHGRYPEIMDLYGGEPGRFHMKGMAHTPKDEEAAAFLETALTTVSQTCRIVAAVLCDDQVKTDPLLFAWFTSSDS